MDFIAIFIIGWIVGHKVCQVLNHMTFREILKDLGVTDQQLRDLAQRKGVDMPLVEPEKAPAEPQNVVEIKIEQHEGILFAFRKDNDQFLAQGPDREQLVARLTENLTPCRVVVSKEDGAELLAEKT
jgi:hypothetical protein